MKITIKNDQDSPVYVTFENDADLNMDSGASLEIGIEPGAEIKVGTDKIETKNIQRP